MHTTICTRLMGETTTSARRSRIAQLGAAALILLAMGSACRADTVASLLGNFTVNQYCGLALAGHSIEMHYVVVYGQLPARRRVRTIARAARAA
jgi:hypothetical protein